MRRALWFQRSLNVAQRLGALAVVLIFLVGALLLFNPWRQQLATLGTAQPAGDPAESVPAGVRDGEPPPPPPVEAPPQPTATAPPAPSPTPRPAPDTEASRPDPAAARPPIVARETPLEAALAIVDAAISADDLQFALVMERAQPLPEASFRVWRRLERCQGVVAAADLDYRVMVHRGRFASVYVSNAEGRYLGDVKMWLARDGVWYLTSINYSSFTALKHGCPP